MPIIQITNTYRGKVLEIVRSCVPAGFSIRTLSENSRQELLEKIEDADYLLASGRLRIDRELLIRGSRLKMIQRTGVGLDSLDLDAIRASGLPLYVNPGVNSQSVAEHTLLLILACLRHLTLLDGNSKRGIWKKQEQGIETSELRGKTVGIIGMGSIGMKAAAMLRAFDARVIYHSRHRIAGMPDAEYVGLDELYARADIVSLHCPLTPETEKMICAESLEKMRNGVILVNTARGGLINEADLLAAIERGKVAFAGLDVFCEEPFSAGNALVNSARVIATPHIGGVTSDAFFAMMSEAMTNFALFHAGRTEDIPGKRIV
ncbi:MAG: 2-hydroxyacid dehydrogenase [Oscillospiraceae bacterium]|nr:2-hydroxyacid dehydrogenase [Oscillospiraceae bacterium]